MARHFYTVRPIPLRAAVSLAVGGGTYTPSDPGPGPEPPPTYEPNRFVSASASGSGNGLSPETAWTLEQAMVNASAGDIVQIGPGVYTGTANTAASNDWVATFAARNAGTEENPIIFFAQYPAAWYYDTEGFDLIKTELRNGSSFSGPYQAVIGTYGFNNQGRRHIVYDGFYIDMTDGIAGPGPSRGSCLLSSVGDITVRRFAFNVVHPSDQDNYVPIFVQPSGVATQYPITIEDNLFVGGANQGNHNAACITTYYATNLRIRYNEFRNNNFGLYIKGGADGMRNGGDIHHNKFINMFSRSINILPAGEPSLRPLRVFQNLFLDCGGGAIDLNDQYQDGLRNVEIYNNTMVGSNGTLGLLGHLYMTSQANADVSVRDNILFARSGNNQVLVNAWFMQNFNNVSQNHNVFYNAGNAPQFAFNTAIQTGIANWRSATGLDMDSIVADPMFVNVGAGDYRLHAESPARTASSTTGPVGCYITGDETIGIRQPAE